jgi:predicted nuclease of restriction endonuclease-like RecB superfamily
MTPFGRGNKYKAKKALFNGRMYDSTAERDYRLFLDTLLKAGEISDLNEQTTIDLHAGIRYKPDFDFIQDGERVYIDVKGFETEVFRLKCKLWKFHGPGKLRIVKRGGARYPWKVIKTIIPMEPWTTAGLSDKAARAAGGEG